MSQGIRDRYSRAQRMDTATSANRRRESRLRYNWPVWISLDSGHDRVVQGQMVDLNSHAAAFTFRTHEAQPRVDQRLSTRFAVPQGARMPPLRWWTSSATATSSVWNSPIPSSGVWSCSSMSPCRSGPRIPQRMPTATTHWRPPRPEPHLLGEQPNGSTPRAEQLFDLSRTRD